MSTVTEVPVEQATLEQLDPFTLVLNTNVRTKVDLEPLFVESIREHGVRVPVVLEKHGGRYRLRDGHRRIAAAQQTGITRVRAIIHAEALDEREWILEAIDYNTRRQGYNDDDKRRVAHQLLDLHVSRTGIAAAFGITKAKLDALLDGAQEHAPRAPRRAGLISRRTLRERLAAWQDEQADRDTIVAELAVLVDDVDDAVVERCIAGEQVPANPAERLEVARRWQASGRSLNELNRLHGWSVHRDRRVQP